MTAKQGTIADADPLLSVVVTCYNEQRSVARTIDDLIASLREEVRSWELIIFDDASTDDSRQEIERCLNRYLEFKSQIRFVPRSHNRGFVHNVSDGASLAQGKYFWVVSSDSTVPPAAMRALLQHIGTVDLIIPFTQQYEGRSLFRRALSKTYTKIVNLLSGSRIRYYNGGSIYRRADFLHEIRNGISFSYCAETIINLTRAGRTYVEVPVTYKEGDKDTSTAISRRTFGEIAKFIRALALWRVENAIRPLKPTNLLTAAKRVPAQTAAFSKSALEACKRYICALEWQGKVCLALSLIAAILAGVSLPFFFGGGDMTGYLQFSYWLAHRGGAYVPWRSPGLPIIEVLTLVPFFNTFYIFRIFYIVLAAAIPQVTYHILRPLHPGVALGCALALILGGVPYIYATYPMSEHPFIFAQLLVFLLVAKYFSSDSERGLVMWIALLCFAAQLIRPTAGIYFWAFFVVAMIVRRRHIRPLLIAALIVVGLNALHVLFDRQFGNSQYPWSYSFSSTGERRLIEVYLSSRDFQFLPEVEPVAAIVASNGPNTRELISILESKSLATRPVWSQVSAKYPSELFAKYASNPVRLVDSILRRPNIVYFGFLKEQVVAALGNQQAAALFTAVASEHGNTGVMGAARYLWHNKSKLLFGHTPVIAGRNLLGLFYYGPFRQAFGRIYYSVPGYEAARETMALYQKGPNPVLEAKSAAILRDPRNVVLISEANGPASKEFLKAIRFLIASRPDDWAKHPWFSEFASEPDRLYSTIFGVDRPWHAPIYESLYWLLLNQYYGPQKADALFAQVAAETLRQHPFAVLTVLDNLLRYTLVRPLGDIAATPSQGIPFDLWVWNGLVGSNEWVFAPSRKNDVGSMPETLRREFSENVPENAAMHIVAAAHATFLVLQALMLIGVLVFILPALRSKYGAFASFLAILYTSQVGSLAVFGNFYHHRYEYTVCIILPLLLSIGLATQFSRRTFS